MTEEGAPAPSKYIRFGTCVMRRENFDVGKLNLAGTELTLMELGHNVQKKPVHVVGVNPEYADAIMNFVCEAMENPRTFKEKWKPEWTQVAKPKPPPSTAYETQTEK